LIRIGGVIDSSDSGFSASMTDLGVFFDEGFTLDDNVTSCAGLVTTTCSYKK